MTPTDLCVRALSMIAASLLLIFAMAPAASGARSDKPAAAGMPMGFETNHGQSAKAVRFLARHPTYTLFLTDDAAVLAALTRPESGRDSKPGTPLRGMVVTLKLAGAQPQTKIVAEGKLPGTVNYFIGNEPKLWRQGIRRHARVRYAQPWPGVDLVWQAGPGALSYRFEVAAGADPGRIAFAVPQAQKLRLDAHGGLVVTTAAGTLRHSSPRLYQLREGRRERVDGGFALNGARQNVIGFRVGRYDRSRPLVIDPTLDFASYYGGNASESHGNQDWSGDGGLPPGLIISEMPFFDIDADASGHLFATGVTSSADFPGADAAQFNASTSAFAMRLDFTAAGPALGYATFLGGDGGDEGHGIVAAADGDAFVTGITRSYDFPTNATLPTELPALQAGLALPGAVNDAFIARLDDTGALTRATYLGGRGDDHGSAIAIDDGGGPGGAAAVVIAGSARRYSAEYSEPATPDAAQPIPAKGWEAFVAVVDPDLTALAYHSFYGGDQNDRAYGLAVRDGRAWLAGITYSTDFPVSADATQPGPGVPTDLLAGCVFESPPLLPPASCADGFVVRLDLGTGAVDYATFLGSPGFDVLRSIAVDGTGSAYVTGSADSGLIDVEHQILIAKLDGDGNEVWRHHHGGATRDAGVDAAVDGGGRLHVTGWSASAGLATPDAFQSEFADDTDAFYAIFHADGTGYSYFSYLGGSYFDYGLAIARDVNDYTYLGGVTSSGDFPLLAALHETEGESGSDLFFARFSPEVSGIPVVLSTSVDPATVAIGTAIDYWINIENPNETILDGLSLVDHLPTALAYTDVAVSTTIGIDCQYDEPAHTVTCGFVGQPPFVPPGLLPGLSSVHVTAEVTAVNPTGAEAELCNHVSLEGPATPATVFDCHMAEPPPEEVGGLAVSIWQEQPDPSAEVRVGDPIKFGIEVSNTGDFGAQCLHLRVETDIDGQPSPVDAPPAACEPGGGCDGVADGLCLGPLAVGESVQAKLQAKAPPPAGDYTLLDIAQEDGALYVDETSLHVKGDPAEVAVSVGAPEPYADGWYRAPVYVSTSAALDWIDVQVAYAGDGVEITRAFAYVPPTLGQNVCNPDVPVAANGGVGCHLLDLTGTGEVTVYFETTEPPRFTATIHSPAEGDDPANNVAQWP